MLAASRRSGAAQAWLAAHLPGHSLPRYDGEYEITNWYAPTHPDTPYQGNIIVAKPGPNRSRITMYNARVTVRDAEAPAEKRWLATEREFRDVLRGEFELHACLPALSE
jgi:N-hydroxyarylamine O-acetyltransferase